MCPCTFQGVSLARTESLTGRRRHQAQRKPKRTHKADGRTATSVKYKIICHDVSSFHGFMERKDIRSLDQLFVYRANARHQEALFAMR
jgi:hypothetical protein